MRFPSAQPAGVWSSPCLWGGEGEGLQPSRLEWPPPALFDQLTSQTLTQRDVTSVLAPPSRVLPWSLLSAGQGVAAGATPPLCASAPGSPALRGRSQACSPPPRPCTEALGSGREAHQTELQRPWHRPVHAPAPTEPWQQGPDLRPGPGGSGALE